MSPQLNALIYKLTLLVTDDRETRVFITCFPPLHLVNPLRAAVRAYNLIHTEWGSFLNLCGVAGFGQGGYS